MTTYIYGTIREYGLNIHRAQEIYDHNESIIEALPVNDSWPPLSREMFAITKNKREQAGPDLQYFGRLIHFGACLKSIEYEWEEWKEKFEDLLTKLYWLEACVHFKTEYSALTSFQWRIDLLQWSVKSAEPITPIKEEYWAFKDINQWEKDS